MGRVAIRRFHFHDPDDYRYARAGRYGTWYPDPGPGLCPECTATRQRRVPPLIIERLPDSDFVGDFVWPGFDDEIVVSGRVKDAIGTRFGGVEFRPIEMMQDPKLKRPERVTMRTRRRVWLPYEGPPLWEFRPAAEAHLDLRASGWAIKRVCNTCGTTFYDTPPYEQRHLVVDPPTWSGAHIFRIRESGWRFCTEHVKEFIEAAGFTNVAFLEDGIIPV